MGKRSGCELRESSDGTQIFLHSSEDSEKNEEFNNTLWHIVWFEEATEPVFDIRVRDLMRNSRRRQGFWGRY